MRGKSDDTAGQSARRVFGRVELAFDMLYLSAAILLGIVFLRRAPGALRDLAALMAFMLAGGDMFHLVPRMLSIVYADDRRWARAMGWGKLAASLTMTVFYVLLWRFGLEAYRLEGYETATRIVYALAAARMVLCLPRGNRWLSREGNFRWAVLRNLPFIALGAMCTSLYIDHIALIPSLGGIGAAIILSFLFYLPAALWAGKNRRLGMLMMPKTLMYIWMLFMIKGSL